jgi:uncharacterized protein with HEPN domain
MKRDVRVYIEDVLESISAIEEYTQTLTEEEFHNNRQVQDAVLRRFEIIGEAVKNIDKNFKSKYPDIPWKSIAGMRDVLIHEYFGVNLKRVWNVIKTDVPILKQEFLKMREQEKLL